MGMLAWMTATALANGAPPVTLQRMESPWRSGRIVRERPDVAGLPYDGNPSVRFEGVDGAVWWSARPLPTRFPDTAIPSVDRQDSLDAVKRGWPGSRVGRGTLVVFPDGDDAKLAWRHAVRGLGGVWSVYVDAHRGLVLAANAESWSTRAHVYDPNPVMSDLVTVDLQGLWRGAKLRGEYASSTKCTDWRIDPAPFGVRVCLDWAHAAKPGPRGDFFEQPREGSLDDPFVQPNAYHHVDAIARWADQRYGLRLEEPIQIFTNFPLTNAFFGDFDGDGDRDLSFGISDGGYNFGYDADVVHHEYGHALVRELAGSMWMQADELGVDWTPGALNEGVADTFAMVLNPDPLLAEGLGRSDRWDEAIRDLEPDRVCPDDLRSQVHRSGRIWGAMAWNMVDDPKIGPELVGDLVVAAVATWDNGTNWPDAAESILHASDRLRDIGSISAETAAAIAHHVNASGMLDCERIIDLERVGSTRQVLLNLGLSGPYERLAGGVQFMHRIPAESESIRIAIEDFDGASQGSGLAIYLRLDAPVEHEASRIEGVGLHHAQPVAYDAVLELDASSGTFVVGEAELPGFLVADAVYGSLASINRSRDPMDADYMSATVSAVAVQPQDAIAQRSTSTGCHSAAGGTVSPLWVGWSGLVMGLATRRRRGR
ncbi:MAG: hypothetical protein VX944_09290 [Myxococcota bacterium]|nr:hypothetical protein [Myxococcota bacterium]